MSNCTSCKAPVIWATTSTLKAIPVDPEPRADGNIVLEQPGAFVAKYLRKGEAHDGPRYVSHFATCPNAQQHRRKK